MKKFLVIDESSKIGDIFVKVCDTLEEANKEAKYQWDYMTDREKKVRHIYVGHVEDTDQYLNDWAFDDEEMDFTEYHSIDMGKDYFDSENE